MDKVTQQNAAGAEESASVSEQLSSQAESMNEIVAQLISLVGGSRLAMSQSTDRRGSGHSATTSGASSDVFHQIAGTSQKDAGRRKAHPGLDGAHATGLDAGGDRSPRESNG